MQVESIVKLLTAPAGSGQFDPRLSVHPDHRLSLQRMGLTTASAFLKLPGEIVSGHPDRHVMRVRLPDGRQAYLKREHRIRWKERFRNSLAGFGWSSKSVREGLTLTELQRRGIPSPEWLSFGEAADGQAFLLLAALEGTALREKLGDEIEHLPLAAQLGEMVAGLHEDGIDHPDLFAKHVFLGKRDIVLLDWQRTRFGHVSRSRRARSIAVLFACLPESDKAFAEEFLVVYNARCRFDVRLEVDRAVQRLRERGKFREQRQRPLPTGTQSLLWLDGEALCVVPAAEHDLRAPQLRQAIYDVNYHGHQFHLADGRRAMLSVGVHQAWLSRAWSRFRGRCWRAPELKRARLLFHLERHHVPAPRLIAYGQRAAGIGMEAFVLSESPADRSLVSVLLHADDDQRFLLSKQLAEILMRLHEAACVLENIAAVRVINGLTLIVDPNFLRTHRRLSLQQKWADWQNVAASMNSVCDHTIVRRFLELFAEGVQ